MKVCPPYLVNEIVERAIEEHKTDYQPGSRRDSLSVFQENQGEDGRGLSDEEMVANMAVLTFSGASTQISNSGVDATSVSLCYIAYLLAMHPEYFQRIAEELGETNIDNLQVRILERLPMLNAVIRESLRLYPQVGSPLGRLCPPNGIKIGGHDIPGGVCHERQH
jgi:cytochrome P450